MTPPGPRGESGFGTKETPGAVVHTEWKTPDIWLRRWVDLGPAPLHDPQLLVHHDEDAEVYLNGILVTKLKGYTTSLQPHACGTERRPLPSSQAETCWRSTAARPAADSTSILGSSTSCLARKSIQLRASSVRAEMAPPRSAGHPRLLGLSPFYTKYVSAHGLPVVGSAQVSDYALKEAAYLVDAMLAHRPDVRDAMIKNKVRCAVMAYNERTTDIPEHSDLTPKNYWNVRARGLGATSIRPAVSGAEENLLNYPGDPYSTENILIHEFGHAIHEMGLNTADPTFDGRLRQAYRRRPESRPLEGDLRGHQSPRILGRGGPVVVRHQPRERLAAQSREHPRRS